MTGDYNEFRFMIYKADNGWVVSFKDENDKLAKSFVAETKEKLMEILNREIK